MRGSYSITDEMDGLSFAARAVFATLAALTYQYQSAEVFSPIIRGALGMSEEAFEATFAELHDAGTVYRSGDKLDCLSLNSSFDLLSEAIGAAGRPSPKEWAELRREVFARHGEYCLYCYTKTAPLAVDHLIPVSKGGSNHIENLVPACKSCNSAKGNKDWSEWLPIMESIRAK